MKPIDLEIKDAYFIPGRGVVAVVDVPRWLRLKAGEPAYAGKNCWIRTTIRGVEKSLWPVTERCGLVFGSDVQPEDIEPGGFVRVFYTD